MPLSLGIIASSGSGPELTYRGSAAFSGQANYTNIPIGPATPDRLVIVCVGGFLPSGNTSRLTTFSVQIGGGTPTLVSATSTLTRYPSGIFSRLITSGVTTDVTTSYGASAPNSTSVSVYTLTGYTSSTAFGIGNASSGSSYSPTITPTARSAIIALANEFGTGAHSWTNIIADYNPGTIYSNHTFSSASAVITSSPSISVSTGTSNSSYAWAGWA